MKIKHLFNTMQVYRDPHYIESNIPSYKLFLIIY